MRNKLHFFMFLILQRRRKRLGNSAVSNRTIVQVIWSAKNWTFCHMIVAMGQEYANQLEVRNFHFSMCHVNTLISILQSDKQHMNIIPLHLSDCGFVCIPGLPPVCGSDGKTYSDICALKNAQCHDPSLTLVHEGCCAKPCTPTYHPVCGSDGETYFNQCVMKWKKCYDPFLTLAHEGECDDGNLPCMPKLSNIIYNIIIT